MRNIAAALLVSVAASAMVPAAWAQETAPPQAAGQSGSSESSSSEIIVTGLKRDQSFIEVPVAVQVFNEQTITRAGITRPQDFLALTPNVTFIQSNHAGEAFVNVRGQTSVRQSESAVAVVIDGVQLATQNEFNGELFDIEQIEVLKGPQSALYGRNAAAGAIIIRTKAPTDEFEGNATFSYGNWNSSKAVMSISGGIIPGALRARLSAAYNDTDGPFDNIITGEKPFRSTEKLGRLRLDWNDGGPFTADVRFNISRLNGGAIAANAQGPNIVNGGVPSPVNSNDTGAPFVTDVPGKNRQDKWSASLKMDYDLGGAIVTSVSSYNRIVDNYQAKLFPYQTALDPRNDAGNAILFGDQTQKYRIANRAFIQELRLSSDDDGPFDWQAGVYFLDSTRNFTTEQGYNGRVLRDAGGAPIIGVGGYAPNQASGAVRGTLDPAISTAIFGSVINRWDRLLVGGGAIAPTRGIDGLDSTNPTNAYDITEYKARNFAPFANAQFELGDHFEIGVAARYDIEKRKVRTLTPNITNPFTGGSFNQCVALFNVAADTCRDSRTFKQLQPKVTATYKMPGLGSIYASYGKGFKSGGFNAFGTREIVVRATQIGITRAQAEALVFVQDSYEKEVSDNYEAGFKLEFAGRSVNINGAAFWTDVKNAQQFIFFPAGSIQAVASIDKVRIKGFEIDGNIRASDQLTLFGGFGYIDPVIRKYLAQPTSVGNRTPYVSKYNITAGFQLNQPISDKLKLTARGEYARQGSVWFDAANLAGTKRGPTDLVNARLGVRTDQWDISLWGRNLLKEEYRVESVTLVTGVGLFNPGFKALTRSYGVEARVRF